MSLMQTLQEITQLQKEVQDQTRIMNDFLRANKDNMALVREELKGSYKGYDTAMIASLSQAEISLTKSVAALQQASDALQRVRAI